MKEGWVYKSAGEVFTITDFVSNGSFASLRENVKYLDHPDYAVLIRLADYSNGFDKNNFVYVSKQSYEYLAKSKLFGGEIIMSNVGSIGKSFLCPNLDCPMTIGPNAILIRSNNNKFFLYYFQSEDFNKKLLSISSRATLKKFNKTNFKTLSIPIPPLLDQQRIVSYLDAEFAKIEALKANAEKQLQAAKDLFQAALKELLTPKEGWVNGILSDIAIIMHGKNQKDVQNELGQYPIYGSGGTIMGYADDYLCEAGTTILGRKGTINNPQYIGTRFWNVDTAFGISAKYDNDNKFLFYLIKLEDWTKRNTGTTLPSLTQTVIANVPISFPLKGEQQRIVARLDALSANVKALQTNYTETITLCNDLKQALLKKVFEEDG